MLNDPDFRKNLAISLVTSILVLIFIDPLLKLAATWLMWLGTNLSEHWSNGIYRSAALGFREKFSFLILLILFSLSAGIAAGMLSANMRSRKEELSSQNKRRVKRPFLIVIFSIVMILSAVDELAINFAELQLNASFNQRITVLAAKTSDQEIKDIRAAWALMEKRKDYESINLEMGRIAAQQKIKLPTPLWE